MQSQVIEFDNMLDEDIFKAVQEEIEREEIRNKPMNNFDLNLNEKSIEEEGNKRQAEKIDCIIMEDEESVGNGDFEKEKKKRNNKPLKKAETSKVIEKNETSNKMEVDEKEEAKNDKKAKNKKKKEKDNDTTMLIEEAKHNVNNHSKIMENEDNDTLSKEEKKNKKKKNKDGKNNCQDANLKEVDEVIDDKFSKIKIEEIEKSDPKQQNRPYSFINIFDNLRGAIKKTLLQKILDNLVDDSKIICKEYNSKVYLASQKNFPIIDDEEMKKIDDELEENSNKLSEQKENISNLNTELKTIISKPTTEQIINKNKTLQANIKALEHILLENERKNIKMIDPEIMKNAEKKFEEENVKFKKIKKSCIDIVDNFCECMEKNRIEIMSMIGLEEDLELINTLKIKNA